MGRLIKPIELTSRALKDLKKIRDFNVELHGVKAARKITESILERIEILEDPKYDFTEIGMIDEDFVHLKHQYRRLIEKQYKITYREGKTKLYINRIFDTRQHPNKNK